MYWSTGFAPVDVVLFAIMALPLGREDESIQIEMVD
jgi:hypothetical protein